ncbi:glucagon b isoform X2 [Pygocentrus nattereri]|uniref:glucagon b isoform X2 n=1 Tax=Pygocentrus nattereri TaxID=42514 RepID=UPI00189154FC|nr:glucagon b isoform X2 [Pygocentrus nattereri]
MKGISLTGFLILIIVQSSWQIPTQDTEENSSVILEDTLFNNPASMKRHSEGTFSNDYSKYLETRRAQDFVQWLMNSKRIPKRDGMQMALTPAMLALTCKTRQLKNLCPG